MNKKTVILFLLLFFTVYGFGQVSWTAKTGVNLSRITGMGEVDMKPGYQFGVGMDYYFNNHWGIQTSLMLVSKGYKSKGNYSYPYDWSGSDLKLKSYNMTENRIYLETTPAMLTYRFNASVNIKIVLKEGVYFSYGVGGRSKNDNTREDGVVIKDDIFTFARGANRFDAGISTGVDFEYKNRYIIGLISEWGFRPVYRTSNNQMYGLSIGYRF